MGSYITRYQVGYLMNKSYGKNDRNNIRGIGLVEICLFMVASGLMIAAGAPIYTLYENHKHLDTTNTNLTQAQSALDAYFMKNGRYPCPAPRTIGVDKAGYGQEVAGCLAAAISPTGSMGGTWRAVNAAVNPKTAIRIGALPVRTLGLPDAADSDGWGHRIVYAITEPYAVASAQPKDMNSGAIVVEDSKGNNATNTANNVVYAVVAPGADEHGAYNSNGVQMAGACPTTPANLACADTGVFASTTLTSNAGGASTFTNIAAYRAGVGLPLAPPTPPPGGCPYPPTIFGNSCDLGGQAHAYFYNISGPSSGGKYAQLSYMNAGNRIKGLEAYTNTINIPDQYWKLGFPNFPSLKSWFGVCYDGTYSAPSTGNYVFGANADDGMAIYIDGIIANKTPATAVVDTQTTRMAGGHDWGQGIGYDPLKACVPGAGGTCMPNPVTGPNTRLSGHWDSFYGQGPKIPLTAGPHSIMVKYMQAWPYALGAQAFVWNITAGDVPPPLSPSTSMASLSLAPGDPPDPHLMWLTSPVQATLDPVTGAITGFLTVPNNYQCPH